MVIAIASWPLLDIRRRCPIAILSLLLFRLTTTLLLFNTQRISVQAPGVDSAVGGDGHVVMLGARDGGWIDASGSRVGILRRRG